MLLLPQAELPAPARANDVAPTCAEETREVTCVSSDRAKADHISEPAHSGDSPQVGYGADGQRLNLAELVRDGLDAVTRPTLKRVRAYVLANAANPQTFSDNGEGVSAEGRTAR